MILLGKTKDEVIKEFCDKYKIPTWALKKFISGMRKNIYISSDIIAVIIGILSILLGVSFIIAIISVLSHHEGLLVFANAHGIFQRVTNMFVLFILFALPILACVFPWIWWSRKFSW